jgi:hypothetical protein
LGGFSAPNLIVNGIHYPEVPRRTANTLAWNLFNFWFRESHTSVTTSVTLIATSSAFNAGGDATVIGHPRGAAAGFQFPARGIATATAVRLVAEIDAE